MKDSQKVSVGLATKAGYSLSAAALAAALIAYLTGDRSDQTLGTLTAAGVAVLAFVITQAGRYLQAYALAKPTPPPAPAVVELASDTIKSTDLAAGAITASQFAGGAISWAGASSGPPPDDDVEQLTTDDVADQDGPGDLVNQMPHLPVSAPGSIKPDNVDSADSHPELDEQQPIAGGLLAHAARPRRSTTYRLSEKHRRTVDATIKAGIDHLMANPSAIHYTQDYRARWSAINPFRRIVKGQFMSSGDCSSTDTWLLRNGLYRAGFHPDVVNGQSWTAGYTGTMINHGRRVVHDENLRFGDQIFYGDQGGGVPEHVATYIGGGLVFSHGSEGGPYILHLDYRTDRRRGEARRYY